MVLSVREFLNTPLAVGKRRVEKRAFLAPLSGLGNISFREVLSSYGGFGLMFMEMCSARAVPRENRYKSLVFRWSDAELSHLVCQLLGGEPAEMADAARRVEDEGFFGVDLNFGCSAARICKRGCGAALLRNPEKAERIVAAVRKSVRIPVFVKFRTGWQDRPEPAADLARRFQNAGADALTFHPRVAPDRRSRPPRWSHITAVKQSVSIPVFGNGNVFSISDCAAMIEWTGCDGISLGRLPIAKPWVFAELTEGRRFDGRAWPDMFLCYIDSLEKHFDTAPAMLRFKRAVPYMAAFFRFGHAFQKKLRNAADFEEARRVVETFFNSAPEVSETPNMNLF
jgi:nifR3 family TIM-barrel protein